MKSTATSVPAIVATMALIPSLASADSVPLTERIEMIDAVTSVAAGADRGDWPRVRQAFADTVTLDYSSLWGGEAQMLAADAVIEQWSGFLPGFDKTLHLLTNHTLTHYDGDAAILEADFQAAHRIEDQMWVLMGHYTYGLKKTGDAWKVESLTMDWTHETGDRGLVGVAAERAKQGQ